MGPRDGAWPARWITSPALCTARDPPPFTGSRGPLDRWPVKAEVRVGLLVCPSIKRLRHGGCLSTA